MVKEKRVLPADAYDTLEFSALVYGGIGAFAKWDQDDAPFCVVGHVAYAQDSKYATQTPLWELALSARLGTLDNDYAVERINARKGRPSETRVSWEEYTRELNIVRGD